MTGALWTTAEVDARLLSTVTAYHHSIDVGELDAADLLYAELDALLDLRLRLPAQRPAEPY